MKTKTESFEKRLAEFDRLIVFFDDFSQRFPKSTYPDLLARLRKDRAELVSTIGRKK